MISDLAAQWPVTPEARRETAEYICCQAGVDPYGPLLQILECEHGHDVRPEKGVVRLGAISIPNVIVHPVGAPRWEPERVGTENLVALAVHCCTYYSIGNCANWLREQVLVYPNAVLPGAAWNQLAFTQVCPPSVVEIMLVARPDIGAWCRGAYYAWLLECRSPDAIHAALTAAADEVWEFGTPSREADTLLELVRSFQIAVVPTTPQGTPDFCIDSLGMVSVSRRDKLLLALVMLRERDTQHPFGMRIKRAVQKAVPRAFVTAPRGTLVLDEVNVQSPQ